MDAAFDRVERIPFSGCWLWMGATQKRNGYGKLRRARKTLYAHRDAWEAANGAIPPTLSVLHSCDVPCCVNPEHLFLGTQRDNMLDMAVKGRRVNAQPTGAAHGMAKLSEDQVRAIRVDARLQKDIGASFGISQAQVSLIRRHKAWKLV